MTKYRLIYDRDFYDAFDTVNEALAVIKNHYEDYLVDKENFPDLYDEDDTFGWDFYEITEVLDMNFEKILTTNHRGTFPKSHRAEGVNFVD